MTLEEHGHSVCHVVDLNEVKQTLQKRAIDLLVLDLDSQDLEEIAALAGEWQGKPLVLQTSRPELTQDFRSWIADEFIYKDGDGQKMVQAVSTLLTVEQRNQVRPFLNAVTYISLARIHEAVRSFNI